MVTEGGRLLSDDIDKRATLSKSTNKDRSKPLTLVMACKCKDGIFFISDSRRTDGEDGASYDYQAKIFKINQKYAIGCSGKTSHIDDFVDYLRANFEHNDTVYDDNGLSEQLKQVVRNYRKKLREETRQELESQRFESDRRWVSIPFSFEGLFAAPIRNDSKLLAEHYGLYWIYINDIPLESTIEPVPIEKISIYKAIGSGNRIANSMLNTISLFLNRKELDFTMLSLESAALICYLILTTTFNGIRTVGGFVPAMLVGENTVMPIEHNQYRTSGKNTLAQLVLQSINENSKLKVVAFDIIKAALSQNKMLLIELLGSILEDAGIKKLLKENEAEARELFESIFENDN